MRQCYECLGLVLLVCFLCGCGTEQMPPAVATQASLPIAPFATLDDDVARHELFRNVQFEEVTQTMPDGSVDCIDIDSGLKEFVLARVTAILLVPGSQFETEFRGDDVTTLTKSWSPAAGSNKASATGLFVVPSGVTSAATRLKTSPSGN